MGQHCDGHINHTQPVACWFFPSPIFSACHKAPIDGGAGGGRGDGTHTHTHRMRGHTQKGIQSLKRQSMLIEARLWLSQLGAMHLNLYQKFSRSISLLQTKDK